MEEQVSGLDTKIEENANTQKGHMNALEARMKEHTRTWLIQLRLN